MKINVFIIFLIAAFCVLSCSNDDFVLVEGGTFSMGSTSGEMDEKPVHSVTLSSFYMSKYEVTFEQYDEFCDDTGREKPRDQGWGRGKRPVIYVSWYDAVDFCNWLSKKEGLTPAYSGSGNNIKCNFSANGYRLPTESEWEYAARGGNKSRGYKYSGSNNADEVSWYWENSESKTQPVGQKKANELGLYDMSGNVYEWCWDWYGYYSSSSQTDPEGPSAGSDRVARGGGSSWDVYVGNLRCALRMCGRPEYRADYLGFRLVRTIR